MYDFHEPPEPILIKTAQEYYRQRDEYFKGRLAELDRRLECQKLMSTTAVILTLHSSS